VDDNLDEILGEFVIEAGEILDQLDIDFVELEKNPDEKKLIENIFRGMHTLKGSSGFFAFKRLEKLAHACETLLSKVREGQIALNQEMVTILLEGFDALRIIITVVSDTKVEPEGDDSAIISTLLTIANGGVPPAPVAASDSASLNSDMPPPPVAAKPAAPAPAAAPPAAVVAPPPAPVAPTPVSPSVSAQAESASDEQIHDVDQAEEVDQSEQEESQATNEAPASASASNVVAKAAAEKNPDASKATNLELAAPVKVNVELLDKLMNLVSELVLARNRLLPFVTDNTDLNFASAVRTIDILTLELQERMMKTRMQPISQVWGKFPRLVRDLSTDLGKKVELIQEGAETELDRTLLEAIRDPLVHIVRNTVDHGIELPNVRRVAKKPETGRLVLRARHENGMVVIEVIDDGAGINFERVREKSIQNNLYSPEKAAKLTDQELIETIFLPGFSTKEVITNLSGRGVGMDVVKNNITHIGGSIEIESPRGSVGTKIRLKIPLTLAIMPALFVRSEQERFAIPQNSLLEMVRFDLATDPTGLEDFYGTPVFRLRGRLHPLLMLNQHLGLSNRYPGKEDAINIAVVQSAGVRFGLVVDEVLDMQEVVVKPIGSLFKGLLDFAGATILGNGRVALILDVDGIAMSSGLIAKVQSRKLQDDQVADKQTDRSEETTMLLFDIVDLGSLAIPLEFINRFEIFEPERVQRNGSKMVVSYGDVIMPLVVVKDFIGGMQKQELDLSKPISVIVHMNNDQPVGLVVDQIHDIVQVPKKLFSLTPPQRGLVGAALMGEKVINVLDLQEIMMLRNLNHDDAQARYPEVIEMGAQLQ